MAKRAVGLKERCRLFTGEITKIHLSEGNTSRIWEMVRRGREGERKRMVYLVSLS